MSIALMPEWVKETLEGRAPPAKPPRATRKDFHASNGWRCAYCCKTVVPAFTEGQPQHRWATIDHIVPRISGGKDGDNLTTACFSCNSEKGSRTLEQFFNRRLDLYDYEETRL